MCSYWNSRRVQLTIIIYSFCNLLLDYCLPKKKAIKRLPIILHIHFSQCNSLIMACDTSKRGGRRFTFITKESNINCLVCSFYCWEFNMTFDFYLSTHIYTQINYRRFSLVISIKAMQRCQSDFLTWTAYVIIRKNFLEIFYSRKRPSFEIEVLKSKIKVRILIIW